MGGEARNEQQLCCLCGDSGFSDALLPCGRCGYRLQHTYCSRYYPAKIDMERWGCEWCLHQEEEESKKRVGDLAVAVATDVVAQAREDVRQVKEDLVIKKSKKRVGDLTVAVATGREDTQEDLVLKSSSNNNKAMDRWKKLARAGLGSRVAPADKRSTKAMDRWRKLAKLGTGRRYKLLADVLKD